MAEATITADDVGGRIEQIDVDDLVQSPFNPRKHLGDVTELANSIAQVGILEALIARRHIPDADGGAGPFELVFGHRRLAAAKKAGRKTVPVIFRDYSDDEALEVQLIENSQREDVHPLDEADALKMLQDRGHAPGAIADKIGRSIPFVTQRIRLTTATKKVRKAFDDGKLSLGAVQQLVKIATPRLMDQALEALLRKNHWSFREVPGFQIPGKAVMEVINSEFLLPLKSVPWDLGDEDLVKAAGPCLTCPKNTEAQRSLFDAGELKRGASMCMDSACYRLKLDARWQQLKKEHPEWTFIDKKGEAENAIAGYRSPFVSVEAHEYVEHKAVAVRTIFKRAEIDLPMVMLRDPKTRNHLQVVPRKELEAAVSKLQRTKPASSVGDSYREQQKKVRLERKIYAAAMDRVIGLAVALLPGSAYKDDLESAVLDALIDRTWSDHLRDICKRLDLEVVTEDRYGTKLRLFDQTLKAFARTATPDARRGLELELVLRNRSGHFNTPTTPPKPFLEVIEALGVDLKRIQQKVKTELTPAPKKKKAKAKPKPKSKRKARAKP